MVGSLSELISSWVHFEYYWMSCFTRRSSVKTVQSIKQRTRTRLISFEIFRLTMPEVAFMLFSLYVWSVIGTLNPIVYRFVQSWISCSEKFPLTCKENGTWVCSPRSKNQLNRSFIKSLRISAKLRNLSNLLHPFIHEVWWSVEWKSEVNLISSYVHLQGSIYCKMNFILLL
jgi:hypothetical protein